PPVLAMRDRPLGDQPREHRLDGRERPTALLEPLRNFSGSQRFAGSPKHFHQVELGVAYALVYRHFVYICKRFDYSCKRRFSTACFRRRARDLMSPPTGAPPGPRSRRTASPYRTGAAAFRSLEDGSPVRGLAVHGPDEGTASAASSREAQGPVVEGRSQ